MPTLEWIGKDKVVNHHLDVPYRVLNHQYTYLGDGKTAQRLLMGAKLFEAIIWKRSRLYFHSMREKLSVPISI